MPTRRALLVGGLAATGLPLASAQAATLTIQGPTSEWNVSRPDAGPDDQLKDDPSLLGVSRTIARFEASDSADLRTLVPVLEAQHGPTTVTESANNYFWFLNLESGHWEYFCDDTLALSIEIPGDGVVQVIRRDRVPLS